MNNKLTSTHIWMHRKIRFMEEYIRYIINAAKQAGWLPNGARFIEDEALTLEVIKKSTDIDDCLRDQIDSAERRFAQLITTLTAGFPERLNNLEKIAYSFGKRYCLELDATVADASKCLRDMFLEGMPNDSTYEVVEQRKNRISWRLIKDIHRSYWIEVGGFPSYFHKMRKQFVKGILYQSDIHVEEVSQSQFVLIV